MQWIAIKRNGTMLKQFEEDGTEHHFHEVEELYNNDDLVSIGYYNTKNDKIYVVSLISGKFYLPGQILITKSCEKRIPILFQRHTVIVGQKPQIKYMFGFKCGDKKYIVSTDGDKEW